jgi:hypothetical protein
MQIETAIETKRSALRDLNEKITQGIRQGVELSPEQKQALLAYRAKKDSLAISKYLQEDYKRMKAKRKSWW